MSIFYSTSLKSLFILLLPAIFSCSSTVHDTPNAPIAKEKDNERTAIEMVLDKFGFSDNYHSNKCVGSFTPENMIDDVPRKKIASFIEELNIGFELGSIFNLDDGFYPRAYRWEGNTLILEYVQVDEIYAFRIAHLDIEKKSAAVYDVYTNDNIGGVRISRQNGHNVVFYNIKDETPDEAAGGNTHTYGFTVEKCNMLTGSLTPVGKKETISIEEELDDYFCKLQD